MTKSVAGKVIAITGGARGIGLATATLLHSLGANVWIGDIDESGVGEAGPRLGLGVHCGLDVTDPQSFTHFLDTVEGQPGAIDVLVNNAGIIAVGRTNTDMIAGVGKAKGIKNADPEDVAKSIAGLIVKPKPRVVIPRSIGVVVLTQRLLPQRVSEALGRALGTEHVFTDAVDPEKRRDYAARVGTS